MLDDHLRRIRESVGNVYKLDNLAKWVEKYMYLEGHRMKFNNGYEFQRDIINDTARVTNTVKPAQIGLTTTTIAYFLAGLATQEPFNVIYALPTAGDASKLTVTKVNPLIYGSPELKRLLNIHVDSSELKQIGKNFLFIRGSKSETAALSISADALIADEIDRADPDTLKQFRSRLQASKHKIIKQFSTPTMDGIGISKEAETSRRYRHMAKCFCCGHLWLPSYHTDIIVPGYKGDLSEITKYTLKDVKWQKARWNCPSCHKDPELDPSRLEWVVENQDDNYEANTYYVSPATACKLLLPSYLVRTSTEFNKKSEWRNQVLGETSEDNNEQLTMADLDKALIEGDLDSSNVHYFGADMGLMCKISIGRLDQMGNMLVVYRENVPLGIFETRRRELCVKYRCMVSVHDVYPYTSEIMRICEYDMNAYGALFTATKSPEMFTIHQKTEDQEEGKLNLRLAKINRTATFDTILTMFKEGKVIIHKQDEDPIFKEQCLSLKRTQIFQGDELVYAWQKTDGNDHGFFSLLYLFVACKLAGTSGGWLPAGMLSLVTAFKPKVHQYSNVPA